MTVRIDYSLTGTGWARADLVVDGHEVAVTASYLSDALAHLVQAAAMLAEGFDHVSCSWNVEPGEYRWVFDAVGDDHMRWRILFFVELWGNEPDERGRVIVDTTFGRRALVAEVLRAAEQVRDDLGEVEYQDRWVSHPYPAGAVDRLRTALRTMSPRVFPWPEAVRSRPYMYFSEHPLQPIDLVIHVLADAMYELARSPRAGCFVEFDESSATVYDDGPGLSTEWLGHHDALLGRFARLVVPPPPGRGALAPVVALCARFEVETVSAHRRLRLALEHGVIVDGPHDAPIAVDAPPFTRFTVTPDLGHMHAASAWPVPLPDVVALAAAHCSHRPWWRRSIVERVVVTDQRTGP